MPLIASRIVSTVSSILCERRCITSITLSIFLNASLFSPLLDRRRERLRGNCSSRSRAQAGSSVLRVAETSSCGVDQLLEGSWDLRGEGRLTGSSVRRLATMIGAGSMGRRLEAADAASLVLLAR